MSEVGVGRGGGLVGEKVKNSKYFLLKGVELTNAAQAPEVNSTRFNKKDTFYFLSIESSREI